MSKQNNLSSQHLISLFKDKKLKQYKVYLKGIQQQQVRAEKAVVDALQQCLIKKNGNAQTIFFALVFYKDLLVQANMDFYCEQDLFPQEIHYELGNICSYNGKQQDMGKRGVNYFVQTLKQQKTKANQNFGYNYIYLALQILSAMAILCPNNYRNNNQRSIFKRMKQNLVNKGIVFPEPKWDLFKENDLKKFEKNYKQFISLYQQIEETPNGLQVQNTKNKQIQSKQKDTTLQKKSKISQSQFSNHEIQQSSIKQKLKINEDITISLNKKSDIVQKKQQKNNNKDKISKIINNINKQIPIDVKQNLLINQISNIYTYTPIKNQKQIHRTIGRTQKSSSKLLQSKIIQSKNQSHRSLPKTQRKSINQNSYKKLSNKTLNSFNSTILKNNQQLERNKTLSQFIQKRRLKNLQQSRLSFFEEIQIHKKLVAFMPQLFQPITLQMNILKQQSLIMAGHGSNFGIFYQHKQLQCRLVKQGNLHFILMIKNISDQILKIAYSPYANQQKKSYVKISSWGNKRQNYKSIISPNQYLDIKFTFATHSVYIGFGSIGLIINEKQYNMYLPLTLLDLCSIKNSYQFKKMDKLKITLLISQWFQRKQKIPDWLKNICQIRMMEYDSNLIIRVTQQLNSKRIRVQVGYRKQNTKDWQLAKSLVNLLQFLLRQK